MPHVRTPRTGAILGGILVAIVALGTTEEVPAEETAAEKLVISIERIWDRALHSAFTDIVRFRDRYYCTFREGTEHIPGINGTVRVIASDDLGDWESVALLDEPHVDLRDPKLSVTPDGRLLVNMGGSFYEGGRRLKMESRVSFSDADGRNFSPPRPVVIDEKVRTNFDWLWRVTWRDGVAWAAVQQAPKTGERSLQLVRSDDAVLWRHVHTFDVPAPTETTLRFLEDGTLLAMIRDKDRSAGDPVGTSRPPYVEWTFRPTHLGFGGPNFVELPHGRFLAGSRSPAAEGAAQFELFDLDFATGQMQSILALPSGGDCSYPGFVVEPERNRVLVSYYSSHEGRTAIYLARLRLDALASLAP